VTPQKSDQPFWEAAVGFATISVRRLSIGAKAKPETAMKGSPGQRLHHRSGSLHTGPSAKAEHAHPTSCAACPVTLIQALSWRRCSLG
jgi:hypothetical protein